MERFVRTLSGRKSKPTTVERRPPPTTTSPPPPPVLTAKFSNNGNLIFTGGADGFIRVWNYPDVKASHLIRSLLHPHSEIRDVCLTKDDSKMTYCHDDGSIFYHDSASSRSLLCFQGDTDGVNAVKFTDFGSVIAAADTCVRLWDCRIPARDPIRIFDHFKDSVTSLGIRRSEIIAGSLDGSIQLFDLRNNRRLSHNLGPPVKCISVLDSEISILASCLDSTIKYLEVDTKYIEPLAKYEGHKCETSKVGCCFTHGGSNVVAGSEDGRVFMWNFLTGDADAVFDGHSSAVTSVDYHPIDDSLLSASMDGSVILRKGVM